MTNGANERTESLLDESVHHRVLTSQEEHVEPQGGGRRVLVPVTERGDAIGIFELTVPQSPDTETLGYLRSAAHALAYTVIASRRHTDLFEWAQRDVPFSLPAEIQRRLLPASYTVEGGPFTLAGWLEPAASVGGDTLDTRSTVSTCTHRSPTPWATPPEPPCSPCSRSAACATRAGQRRHHASRRTRQTPL